MRSLPLRPQEARSLPNVNQSGTFQNFSRVNTQPADTEGEGGVLVFAGEVGRSVAADYEFGEVAFVVVIVGASEERTHAVVACSAPYFGELFGGGGCVDVGFVHGYDEEVVVVGLEVGVVVGRHGGTDEGANVVKAESLVP